MVRTFVGIFSGALVAALTLIGCWYGIAQIYPLPSRNQFETPDLLAEYASGTPSSAIAAILGAWALAALLGGWAAASISKPNRGAAALVIGASITATVLVYATLIPNADWITVVGALLPVPFAVLATLLATPRNET